MVVLLHKIRAEFGGLCTEFMQKRTKDILALRVSRLGRCFPFLGKQVLVKKQRGADLNLLAAHDAVRDGVDGESRHAARAELLGDILAVSDDRGGRYPHTGGYLLVDVP